MSNSNSNSAAPSRYRQLAIYEEKYGIKLTQEEAIRFFNASPNKKQQIFDTLAANKHARDYRAARAAQLPAKPRKARIKKIPNLDFSDVPTNAPPTVTVTPPTTPFSNKQKSPKQLQRTPQKSPPKSPRYPDEVRIEMGTPKKYKTPEQMGLRRRTADQLEKGEYLPKFNIDNVNANNKPWDRFRKWSKRKWRNSNIGTDLWNIKNSIRYYTPNLYRHGATAFKYGGKAAKAIKKYATFAYNHATQLVGKLTDKWDRLIAWITKKFCRYFPNLARYVLPFAAKIANYMGPVGYIAMAAKAGYDIYHLAKNPDSKQAWETLYHKTTFKEKLRIGAIETWNQINPFFSHIDLNVNYSDPKGYKALPSSQFQGYKDSTMTVVNPEGIKAAEAYRAELQAQKDANTWSSYATGAATAFANRTNNRNRERKEFTGIDGKSDLSFQNPSIYAFSSANAKKNNDSWQKFIEDCECN